MPTFRAHAQGRQRSGDGGPVRQVPVCARRARLSAEGVRSPATPAAPWLHRAEPAL